MTQNKVGDLYRLDFADGKSYIGASTSPAEKRYKYHRRAALRGNCTPLYLAWRKYGDPSLIILKKDLPEKKLWSMESDAIVKFNTKMPYGYNSQLGRCVAPGMLGKVPTIETRVRMSHAGRGKKRTTTQKENNRQAQLKRFQDPKEIEKNRQGHLGKRHSEETKKKLSLIGRGRPHTEVHKENLRKALKKYYCENAVSNEAREKYRKTILKRRAYKTIGVNNSG